jgi:DNA-binding LytR/AlgR family response regulator
MPSLKALTQLQGEPVWLQGNRNYTWLYFDNGSKQLFALSLSKFLARYPYLVRAHKQAAINPRYVLKWHLADWRHASVWVGLSRYAQQIPVARRRVKALVNLQPISANSLFTSH